MDKQFGWALHCEQPDAIRMYVNIHRERATHRETAAAPVNKHKNPQ